MKYYLFLSLIQITINGLYTLDQNDFVLPEDFKPCNRNDLNWDKCLKDLIQDQITSNSNNTRLNFSSLEPWVLPKTRYVYSGPNLQLTLITENVKIHGLNRTSIVNVNPKIKKEGMQLEVMAHFPQIRIEGDFMANIKANDFKLKPKGRFNTTITNIFNTAKLSGTFIEKNKQQYLQLKKFSLNPKIDNVKFNANGIFPTDLQLNNIVVQFVNSYWRSMYPLILRETRSGWEPTLLEVTNQVLLNVPFNKLLTNKNK